MIGEEEKKEEARALDPSSSGLIEFMAETSCCSKCSARTHTHAHVRTQAHTQSCAHTHKNTQTLVTSSKDTPLTHTHRVLGGQ